MYRAVQLIPGIYELLRKTYLIPFKTLLWTMCTEVLKFRVYLEGEGGGGGGVRA